MVWFNLLKVQRQTQRQGFRLDDKDEDYVLEDEDDCLEKLKNYFKSFFKNPEINFLQAERVFGVSDKTGYAFIHLFDGPKEEGGASYPDEYYCRAKEYLERWITHVTNNKRTYPSKEHNMSDDKLSYSFKHSESDEQGKEYYIGHVTNKDGRSVCGIFKGFTPKEESS